MYCIVGLGNPGEEHKLNRHNTGRIVVQNFAVKEKFKDFKFNKKLNALVNEGKYKKEKIIIILPETFMNKSGLSMKPLITSKKKDRNLIVVHDDIDLPLGKIKISVGKSSAGHRGVESIIKNIKTRDFIRIRVGISQSTSTGKIKKPKGEKLLDFLMGNFKPEETEIIKKISKKIIAILETIINEGINKAISYSGFSR
jgi:PTH1 family peptidyl-tRNA hydrolase